MYEYEKTDDEGVTTRSYEDHNGDDVYEVIFRGTTHMMWNDRANVDFPEDLTWNREISAVFYSGVRMGEAKMSRQRWALYGTRTWLDQVRIGGDFELMEERELVALFDSRVKAEDYIRLSKLANPQPRRGFTQAKIFRKKSLLHGFDYAEVESYGWLSVPQNPKL